MFEGVQDSPPEDAKRNIQPYNPHTSDSHLHTIPTTTSHHHYPEHRRSLDNSNIRLTSQRSPPQDRQSLPSQRSPPQEPISHQWSPPQDVTSRSAPPSQRSPPQDSSSSRSQKSPSHRSPPQDEVLHYQYRMSMNKETELPLTSSYSVNDFTHANFKYGTSGLSQYKTPLSSGKANNYTVHHHQHPSHVAQQQSSSGNPPSSKHKLKGQDMYGLHSNKTHTHSSKTQTHSSKSHSHTGSSGLSKLQSMRSYTTKEAVHRGGGGEGGSHPLSVSHSSPQHKAKYS